MQDTLFSLIKIALQMDPCRGATVADEFKTILSTILKESPVGAQSKPTEMGTASKVEKLNVMNDFMQQNITEQFMGRSPSLVIHPIPYEGPSLQIRRENPFSKYAFDDKEDIQSLSSIGSAQTQSSNKSIQEKDLNFVEIHVVKEPSASKEELVLPPLSTQVKIVAELNAAELNAAELNAATAEDDAIDAEEEFEEEELEEEDFNEDAFEEFPLKDGIHYKDPDTNIVYKEKEGITRVGVFNPDTNKFKRDTK